MLKDNRELVGSLPKVFKQLKTDLPTIKDNLRDREITDVDLDEVVQLYDRQVHLSQLAQQLRRERNLIQETLKTQPGKVEEVKVRVG